MNNPSSRDLLSGLPLDIIHAILERVPIRDAARTSILSSKWKYKWASLPHLTFDDSTVTSSKTELTEFITKVLLLHQGPILKFKLDSQSPDIADNPNCMHPWLSFLSKNGIRMLSLRFCLDQSPSMRYIWEGFYKIPCSIYSCQNLTHLEIYGINPPPPPPSFTGFLFLKSLVLQYADTSSASTFRTVFADLPLLEELKLETCLNIDLTINAPSQKLEACSSSELRFNAPNLMILDLNIDATGDICIHAPLLSKMSISLAGIPRKESSVRQYPKLLGVLTHLEKLKGNSYFFEFLSLGIESCSGSLVFPKLRVIEVTEGEGKDDDYHWMKAIECLLASSPVLEKLICYSSLWIKAFTLLLYPRASRNIKVLYR